MESKQLQEREKRIISSFHTACSKFIPPTPEGWLNTQHSFFFEVDNIAIDFIIGPQKAVCVINKQHHPAHVEYFALGDDMFFMGAHLLDIPTKKISVYFNGVTRQALGIYAVASLEPIIGECRMQQQFMIGQLVGNKAEGFRPEPTLELVGKHFQAVFSQNLSYEQMFLQAGRYSYYYAGDKKFGVPASEACTYYKFDENIYIYSWCEMSAPNGTTYFLNVEQNSVFGEYIHWGDNGVLSSLYTTGKLQIINPSIVPMLP